MSFYCELGLGDNRTWYVGNVASRASEIIIPIDQIGGLTDEALGNLVRTLVVPAQIETALNYVQYHLSNVTDGYCYEMRDVLKIALTHPFYKNRLDEINSSLSILENEISTRKLEHQKAIERELRRAEQVLRRQGRMEKSNAGYVYLIQSPTGNYKIGKSKNPSDRAKTFAVKLPFEVEMIHVIPCANYHQAETALHEQFSAKRVSGEWFALTPEDVAAIKAIQSL